MILVILDIFFTAINQLRKNKRGKGEANLI